MAGFGKYLAESTDDQRRRTPGYRNGFGQMLDGSRDAANEKRSQLARQRRQRIADAQRAGTIEYEGPGRNGKPRDPLADDREAIELAWSAEFGPKSGGADDDA